MSSKIPSWNLSTSNLMMHELGTTEEIAKTLARKNQQVAEVFGTLVGQSGHNTEEGWTLARLTPNQKQQMIAKLSLAADFDAFSGGDNIKVGISKEASGVTPIGSFVYISKGDCVTKLKNTIRECILNGEDGEMVLRDGFRGGDIINPVKVNLGSGEDNFRVVTGDSDVTMLSLGFKNKFLDMRLEVIDK